MAQPTNAARSNPEPYRLPSSLADLILETSRLCNQGQFIPRPVRTAIRPTRQLSSSNAAEHGLCPAFPARALH